MAGLGTSVPSGEAVREKQILPGLVIPRWLPLLFLPRLERDTLFFVEPAAEIDQPASFAAERHRGARLGRKLFVTKRTTHGSCIPNQVSRKAASGSHSPLSTNH
jgi:hypothetical protein